MSTSGSGPSALASPLEYFCTSKASKVSTSGLGPSALASPLEYFCTSKESKVSTSGSGPSALSALASPLAAVSGLES